MPECPLVGWLKQSPQIPKDFDLHVLLCSLSPKAPHIAMISGVASEHPVCRPFFYGYKAVVWQ